MAAILNDRNVCTECGGTDFIVDFNTGEHVCKSCGYMISSTCLDQGQDWRTFNLEQ